MLAELSLGRRRVRDAVLPLLRELRIDSRELDSAYRHEIESLREKRAQYRALARERVSDVVLQRLHERVDEGLFTLLHLLAARQRDTRLAAVADGLRRSHGARRHAVLLEALDALLPAGERDELLPLFDLSARSDTDGDDAPRDASALPGRGDAALALLDDPDELTRELARAAIPGLDVPVSSRHNTAVPNSVERALLLKAVPVFAGLSTKQLVHVAERMDEELHPPGATIVRAGDPASCRILTEGDANVHGRDGEADALSAGDFFGEIAVFDPGRGSPHQVTTQGGARALRLSQEALYSLIEEFPGIGIHICEALSSRLLNEDD